jgi:hypothetical protein
MTDPQGAEGVDDPRAALEHQVDALTQRFPDVPRAEMSQRVHRTYDELDRTARLKSHLISLTSARVTEELLQSHHHPA